MCKPDPIYVAASELGRAVFTGEPFAAKQRIGKVDGKTFYDAEYGSEYCIELGPRRSLEPQPPFRYLNHSCDPNCELVIWKYDDPADWEIHLYATKPIKPGDELTIDYAWSSHDAIPCCCRSANCRGWIVALEELPQLDPSAPGLQPQAQCRDLADPFGECERPVPSDQ